MSDVTFSKRKPAPGSFELERAVLIGLASKASTAVLTAANKIAAAPTAEEFAAAIADVRDALAAHADGFAELVKASRHWR